MLVCEPGLSSPAVPGSCSLERQQLPGEAHWPRSGTLVGTWYMALQQSGDGIGGRVQGPGVASRIGSLTLDYMCQNWASSKENTEHWLAGPDAHG